MTGLQHAGSFKDLIVYQKAQGLSGELYELSKAFPRDETFALTDQLRRASRSVGAQIAEAWAKRRYVRHFVSKLSDADGEQMETQHWIDCAADCGYLSAEKAEQLRARAAEIGRMLGAMMSKADHFCRPEALYCEEAGEPYWAGFKATPDIGHCRLNTEH